jgi:hypothetical protein
MAAASLMIRIGAQVAEAQKAFAEVTRSAQRFERDFANTASSVSAQQKRINDAFATFSGDRLARDASAVAKAVEQIGGAARLTAAEQAKVNALMTEAIAKYQALGQTAPKAMLDLAAATQKVETATTALKSPTAIFANSIGDLEERGRGSSAAMGLLTGTFGKFTAAGVAVNVINRLGGELSNLVARGSQIGPLEQSFERLSTSVGQNSEDMLDSLRTATRGMVQDFDLMQSSNKALLLGLPVTADSMAELAKTASVLGKAMGQDATKSFDDLITALGRSSPLILDNLGLTVSVEKANEKYAASLGKTADALTDAEKQLAFYNEAMVKARERTNQIGEQSLTASEHAVSAWNIVANVVTRTAGSIDKAAGELISGAGQAASSVAGFFADLYNNGVRATLAVRLLNDEMRKVTQAGAGAAPPVVVSESLSARVQRLQEDLKNLTVEQRKNIAAGEALGLSNDKIAEKVNALGGKVQITAEHLKLLETNTRAVAKANTDLERSAGEMVKRVQDQATSQRKVETSLEGTLRALREYVTEHRVANEIITATIPELHTWADELNHARAGVAAMVPALGTMNAQMAEIQRTARGFIQQATAAIEAEFQRGLNFGGRLSQTIISAFQGGGDVGQAIGAQLGADIGGVLGKTLGKTLAKSLGETLGGAIGGLLGPLGALAGSLLGDLFSNIGGPSADELLGRDVVASFEQTLQGTLTAQQKLEAGNESWKLTTIAVRDAYVAAGRTAAEAEKAVAKLWASSKSGADASRLAVLEIQAVMDIAASKQEEIAQSQQDSAKAIEEATAGIRSQIDALSSEYDALNKSIANEAPEEVLGIVETLARERMKAIEIERTGLEAEMDRVTKQVEENLAGLGPAAEDAARAIEDALRNIRIEPISIPIESSGVPALGSGGIVRKPTLALIGESGPEAVVPLGSGFGDAGAPIVTQVFLDGRQIAEATVPHIPHVVRRRT